jgi:hypothetical protein
MWHVWGAQDCLQGLWGNLKDSDHLQDWNTDEGIKWKWNVDDVALTNPAKEKGRWRSR